MGFIPSLLLSLAVTAGAVSESPAYGPIPMANHHPLYVGLLHPAPERAQIADSPLMRVNVNHTNIFLFNTRGAWSTGIDKEITQLDLSFTYPVIEENLEVGIDVSAFYSSGGVLDGAIRWWHGRLGVKGYTGQADAPDYRFMDIVRKNGRNLVNGESGASVGDMDFSFKKILYIKSDITLSAQALLRAPVGDADAGYGAGSWELAGRALAEMRSDWLTLHAGLGAVAPTQMKRMGQTVDLDTMWMGFVSVEAPVWDRLNLVVQSMYNTSPLKSADIYQYSREFFEITFGFNYRTENGKVFTFGFSENLNQTAPDFTIHLSVEGGV
ncbi:MAG: DUF3187 family protein [Nitrospinae bacterium]|nr:DUF3187 family protein [Nitrospinota bacterium]